MKLSKICSTLFLITTIFLISGCAQKEIRPEAIYYPPLPAEPKLQFLTSYNRAEDVMPEAGGFNKLVFGEDKETLDFIKPYGLAVHENKIYICDIRGQMVHVLDPVNQVYKPLTDQKILKKPTDICFDDDSNAYVADAKLAQVVVFDKDGNFLRFMGDPLTMKPVDVAIRGRELYVCDIKNHTVLVWDKDSGEEIRRFGKPGSEPGDLFHPSNILVDSDGNLYVSDTTNCRVQKFDPEGNVAYVRGKIGATSGSFVRPKGIALDRDENLYVVDAAFENVQIFDKDGRLLLFFGNSGINSGDINLPADVIVSYDLLDYYQTFAEPGFKLEYLVLISSNFGRNKVNVYGFGKSPGAAQ